MADVEFDGIDGRSGAFSEIAASSARLIGLAGAATSVALVLGLGYWGYKLAVRDITGIPVVRAMEGPMRLAPEDPGGLIAFHQGLSVNLVAAEGGIAPPSDRLILAPAPVGLSEDDSAGSAVAMVAPVSGRSSNTLGLAMAPMPAVEPKDAPLQTASLDKDTDIAALTDALNAGVVPLSGDINITIDSGHKTAFSLPKGALAQSPRPRARPEGSVMLVAASTNVVEITGDNLTSGTRLVQLGAFDSEDIARKEWDRLSGKFGDLLGGKTRIVQAAKSGGRTFFRLRAMGFADEADSRRFCSALVAERAACIPVAVR